MSKTVSVTLRKNGRGRQPTLRVFVDGELAFEQDVYATDANAFHAALVRASDDIAAAAYPNCAIGRAMYEAGKVIYGTIT